MTKGPSPLQAIQNIDYTILFARDLDAMRAFYSDILGFHIHRSLGPTWIEYRVGGTTLALTKRGGLFDDPSPPKGMLSAQLAFRVAPNDVDACSLLFAQAETVESFEDALPRPPPAPRSRMSV